MSSLRSGRVRRCYVSVALLLAFVVAGDRVSVPVSAQTTKALAQGTATPTPPSCNEDPPATLPPGNLKLTVVVDPTTLWQPRDGAVKFTIKGTGFSPDNVTIVACFQWKQSTAVDWYQSPSLRLISNGTVAGAFDFSATVPPDFPPARSWWIQRVLGLAHNDASTGLDLVPVANFRIMAKSIAATPAASAWLPLDVILPIGITSTVFSFTITIVLIVIAWTALYQFAKIRDVPGENIILKIISTKNGYASLSQLQIILWSFVIGAGAVYVMSLSGNLIEITQGTLVLLGISGTATVASKLQSYKQDQSAPATPPTPPAGTTTPTGSPAPSVGATGAGAAKIGTRIPLWSDLVVASDNQNEIDVTRVQMLFFTVIVALFVVLRILASDAIPEIPEGYLLLMGISNGVYLTAKFVPS
jgi:hypothetical protein